MGDDDGSPRSFLRTRSSLAATPVLAEMAARLFEYTQFLLDKDENLTRTQNLNGQARELLRRRALELLGDPPADPGATVGDGDGDGDGDDDGDGESSTRSKSTCSKSTFFPSPGPRIPPPPGSTPVVMFRAPARPTYRTVTHADAS